MPDYILSTEAEGDLLSIIQYTTEKWGNEQAEEYIRRLDEGFSSLSSLLVKRRFLKRFDELYVQRCEHHFIFYLFGEGASPPIIIAILHENMDLIARLKDRLND